MASSYVTKFLNFPEVAEERKKNQGRGPCSAIQDHESKHKLSHQVTRSLIPELLVESVSRLATVLDLESPPRLESTD